MTGSRIAWSELATKDAEAARAFYAAAFGWSFFSAPMPGGGVYWVAKDGEANVAGIFEFTEAMMPGVPPHWMTYIAVENAEAAAARVRSAGGEILKGPFNVPGTGDVVIAKDSAGAVFGMLAPEDCA